MVGPGTALFCCCIVVFLVVTVLMFLFRIMPPFLSLRLVCVFVCVLFLADLRVCPCASFKKVVAAFSFMRKVKRKRLRGGGGGAESGVIDSMCGQYIVHLHTQTHTRHPSETVCPSLKTAFSLTCLIRECCGASWRNRD